MKRRLCILLCAALLLGLCGCGDPSGGEDAIRVVVTIFPLYDWARNVAGNDPHADVSLLVKNGVDLHSFQPTTADMLAIRDCDLFIYVGGESDGWVHDALESAENPDRIVLNLMDVLGDALLEETCLEGMEEEAGEEETMDEHIWLSLRNARICVEAIADALTEADGADAEVYSEQAAAYADALDALDRQYAEAVEAAPFRTLLFPDRFPFRYLAEDYGIKCYAAFSGCSAETEASFETVAFLAETLKEQALPAVVTIEGSDVRLAETVISSSGRTDCPILTLRSMQGVSAGEISGGASYLGIMEENLAVLKQALGGS